ncbi:hypothetical protein A4X13_0g4122 [Tilletia indica]|uniref:Uncharacterized protein n=1 Tax=Tilletia indica TaxID=43049 RepID=A0A177TBE6_9BASI|nr:hypothetical protein A4X13_0g4122 [Tilletia indica]
MSTNLASQLVAQGVRRAFGAQEEPAFGPGITKMSQLGYGKGYTAPWIRHVNEQQGTGFNHVDSKDEDVRRQMDSFVHLRPDKVLPLHIGSIRSWRTDLWAALAPTPIARRMLVGLEYGPGMNQSDPTAYTAKYSSDFDLALGGFLARTVSHHLRDVVITKLFREGEERGTVIFDHLTEEVEKHSSLEYSKLLGEYVRTQQEPTESIKQFADPFRKLCEQMDDLDLGSRLTKIKSISFLTKLQPIWKEEVDRLFSTANSASKEEDTVIASLEAAIIWMERFEEQALEKARQDTDGDSDGGPKAQRLLLQGPEPEM